MSWDIVNADCVVWLREQARIGMQVDTVVCDPPYHLASIAKRFGAANAAPAKYGRDGAAGRLSRGFMGSPTDAGDVSFQPETWRAVLDVMAPGGRMAAFGGCYDEQTEVLTDKGWIGIKYATKQHAFASLNLQTHKVSFVRPIEIVQQPHSGPMHRYKTNKIDLLVTPNHKMVASDLHKRYGFSLRQSEGMSNAVRMTKTSLGREDATESNFTLKSVEIGCPGGRKRQMPDVDIPASIWAAFMGLWIAEGHTTKAACPQGENYHAAITHFNTENVQQITAMLTPYFNVKLYPSSGRLRINDKRLYAYLRPFGKAWEKRVPEWLKTQPVSIIRIFLDWYGRGDGDADGRLYTCSKTLVDDLQEIAMYAGYAADAYTRKARAKPSQIGSRLIHQRRPQYVVRLLKTQTQPEVYARRGSSVKTTVPACEWGGKPVYCVELPVNHTLYVRRNGKTVWCGNTRTWWKLAAAIDAAGFEIEDTILWVYGQGLVLRRSRLKPCWEPILICRAPGPVQNLGIEDCRVPSLGGHFREGEDSQDRRYTASGGTNFAAIPGPRGGDPAGRWPGNLIHDGSQAVLDCFPDAPGQLAAARTDGSCKSGLVYGKMSRERSSDPQPRADSGSAARFFTRCEFSEEEHRLLYQAKAPSGDRMFFCTLCKTHFRGNGSRAEHLHEQKDWSHITGHPTVKPVSLLRHLVKLLCRPGGLVLDPFCGSATTIEAAVLEGRDAIGIELDVGHAASCEARMQGLTSVAPLR